VKIEMTDRLAPVLIDVQDVLTKHGLEIGDLPCGAMWQELVRAAINKVSEDFPLTHPTFNVTGTQTGRFPAELLKWEVWCEGYQATGEQGFHHLMGTHQGRTFEEACRLLLGDSKFFNQEKLTYWSCRLFPTKGQAAESFG
jgi:hypothetical protein